MRWPDDSAAPGDDSEARTRLSILDPADGEPSQRDQAPVWTTLADGRTDHKDRTVVSTTRVLLQVGIIAVIVIGLVVAGGVVVARRTAEREAINGAAQVTDLLAEAVVQPALRDSLLSDSPAAARASLDAVVTKLVLSPSVSRVKLWTPQGRIVYSDEKRLIGKSFPVDEGHRDSMTHPQTLADVTDLQAPENVYERGNGKLLEVYRPVWTPSGQPLLFETYTRYTTVTARTTQLWRSFAGLMVSTLLLLVVLLLPLLWALLDRLRRGQRLRESLLQHAVDRPPRNVNASLEPCTTASCRSWLPSRLRSPPQPNRPRPRASHSWLSGSARPRRRYGPASAACDLCSWTSTHQACVRQGWSPPSPPSPTSPPPCGRATSMSGWTFRPPTSRPGSTPEASSSYSGLPRNVCATLPGTRRRRLSTCGCPPRRAWWSWRSPTTEWVSTATWPFVARARGTSA